MNKRKYLLIIASFIVVALLIGFTVIVQKQPPMQQDSDMAVDTGQILTITYEGGLSIGPDGYGTVASSSIKLYSDGTYGSKTVSASDMQRIEQIINSFDPNDYPPAPYGDCGLSVADGTDTYFTLTKRFPNNRFEPCQHSGSDENSLTSLIELLDKY